MSSMANEQLTSRGAHLLVIPYPTYGHIMPLLSFLKAIARTGIIITVASYEDRIPDDFAELQSLRIRFIDVHNSTGTVLLSPGEAAKRLQEDFKPVMEKLVNDKEAGVPGPTSIISDMFLIWTQDIADRLEVPRYMFVPSGLTFARYMQSISDLFARGRLRISQPENKLAGFEGVISIPGVPNLRYHEHPSTVIMEPDIFEFRCRKLWQAAGVIVNSFDELEEKAIEAWRKPKHPGFEHTQAPKLYPIGPITSHSAPPRNMVRVQGCEDSVNGSLRWLASQPPKSVLYVAFGSWVHISPLTVRELALGLEGSNQRFLWVLPRLKNGAEDETSSLINALPSGFQARVGDRGYLCTGWAPQLQILAHSSIGGFLTHAGWNSCLESITKGVPMITCPQWAEQHINSRILVDDLKIADEIRTGPDDILERKEVERAVLLVMVEPEGEQMRKRASVFQTKAAAALAEGGSQSRAVQEFTTDLLREWVPAKKEGTRMYS